MSSLPERHWQQRFPTFQQVLLRKNIAALDNLLQQRLQDPGLIAFEIDQLAKPDDIAAHQQFQLAALLHPLFPFPRGTLMLQPHPQLVHLHEIRQDEVDRVLQVAFGPIPGAGGKVISRLSGQVVS